MNQRIIKQDKAIAHLQIGFGQSKSGGQSQCTPGGLRELFGRDGDRATGDRIWQRASKPEGGGAIGHGTEQLGNSVTKRFQSGISRRGHCGEYLCNPLIAAADFMNPLEVAFGRLGLVTYILAPQITQTRLQPTTL